MRMSSTSIIISQFMVFNIVSCATSMAAAAAAVLMELMEAILLDGVVLLGNHSIYFYISSIITNLFFKFPYSSLCMLLRGYS